MCVPVVPVSGCLSVVFHRVLLLAAGLLLGGVARQVQGRLHRAQPVQDVGVELVRQLAAHFDDFPSATVVSQSPRHLLIGHGLAVAFALAPALCQLLLVLGNEVEGATAAVRPLDGVTHVGVIQSFVEVLVQPELLATCGRKYGNGSLLH